MLQTLLCIVELLVEVTEQGSLADQDCRLYVFSVGKHEVIEYRLMLAVLHALPLDLLPLEVVHRVRVKCGNHYLLVKHPGQQHVHGVDGLEVAKCGVAMQLLV